VNKLLCIVILLAVTMLAFAGEPETNAINVATTQIDISFPTYLVVMNNYHLPQNNLQYSKPFNKNYSYEPAITQYFSVMSINEYTVGRMQGSDDQLSSFRTYSSIGAKYAPYFGAEAYVKLFTLSQDSLYTKSYNMSQTGFGMGLPDADHVRVFVYALVNDFSNSFIQPIGNNSFSGVKAQLAKRMVNRSQFTEFGVEYENYSYPDGYNAPRWAFGSSMFDAESFNWAPDSRISAYITSSSIKNPYLEPYTLRGIAPSMNPLALVDEAAYAFSAKVMVQAEDRDSYTIQDTYLQLGLPINFTRFVGMNLNYQYWKQEKEYDNPIFGIGNRFTSEAQNFGAGLRLALLGSGPFKVVGGTEYLNLKHFGGKKYEYLNFSTDLVLHVSSHFALSAYFRHNNLWLMDKGAFETKPLGYYLGSTLAVRL